jgi:hypothetical protein
MHWSKFVERFSTSGRCLRSHEEETLVTDARSLRRPSEVVEEKLTALLKYSRKPGRPCPSLIDEGADVRRLRTFTAES